MYRRGMTWTRPCRGWCSVVAAAVLSAALASVATTATGKSSPQPSAQKLKCGEERWPVKTLSDKRAKLVNFHPKHTTVDKLRRKPRPDVGTDSPRFPGVERRTFRVRARLVEFVVEDDHDVHLVISSLRHHSRTMIVEFPDVACNGARRSIKKRPMRRARNDLIAACGTPTTSFHQLHGKATITGVGFFDIPHGQTGIAPNAIELHPVLGFSHARCSS